MKLTEILQELKSGRGSSDCIALYDIIEMYSAFRIQISGRYTVEDFFKNWTIQMIDALTVEDYLTGEPKIPDKGDFGYTAKEFKEEGLAFGWDRGGTSRVILVSPLSDYYSEAQDALRTEDEDMIYNLMERIYSK
jgi:hypothetical protein